MTATPREIVAMRRAIALSAHGIATTSPNPPVGCVILDHTGEVAGEGYHARKGEPHAEVNALKAAGDRASDGTAVVTLEPCNHLGRTPPCHQALIDAGIVRVAIAVMDPTSRGAGGAFRLRAAGVDVETGVLEDETRLVLGPWLEALISQRPRVTWAYRVGPEGIGPIPEELCGSSVLRHKFDAVLDGRDHLEEGVPGAHGESALWIPSTRESGEPDALLPALYAGGVRTLLLHGDAALAQPFLRRSCVDHVEVWLTPVPATESAHDADAYPLLPAGFRLDRVDKRGAAVVINAVPE